MKLVFHPDTNMNQAVAEVVGYVNRSRAFMPPGAVPPFIIRFDAGSVPIGQLVFTAPTAARARCRTSRLTAFVRYLRRCKVYPLHRHSGAISERSSSALIPNACAPMRCRRKKL